MFQANNFILWKHAILILMANCLISVTIKDRVTGCIEFIFKKQKRTTKKTLMLYLMNTTNIYLELP